MCVHRYLRTHTLVFVCVESCFPSFVFLYLSHTRQTFSLLSYINIITPMFCFIWLSFQPPRCVTIYPAVENELSISCSPTSPSSPSSICSPVTLGCLFRAEGCVISLCWGTQCVHRIKSQPSLWEHKPYIFIARLMLMGSSSDSKAKMKMDAVNEKFDNDTFPDSK